MATGSNVTYVAQKLLTSNVFNGLRGPAAVVATGIINTTFRRAYSHRCYHTNNNNNSINGSKGVANGLIPAADDSKGVPNGPSPLAAATDDSFYGFSDVFEHFSATTADRLKWLLKIRSLDYQFHSFHVKQTDPKWFSGFSYVSNRFTATTANRLTRVLTTPSTTLLIHPIRARNYPKWDEVTLQLRCAVPEEVKVCVINQDNTTSLFVEAEGNEFFKLKNPRFKNYNSWIDLPDNHVYKINDIKAEIHSMTGNLRLIFPKLKQDDENNFEQQQTSSRNVKVDIDSRPSRIRIVIYGEEMPY